MFQSLANADFLEDVYREPMLSLDTQSGGMDSKLNAVLAHEWCALVTPEHLSFFFFLFALLQCKTGIAIIIMMPSQLATL